jgi:Flp pilus assembly pilin Flp
MMERRQHGQSVGEYAIIIGIIALVVIAALILFGEGIGGVFRQTSDALEAEASTPTPEPTATLDANTFTCSYEFALFDGSSVPFNCVMDPGILNIQEVEQITLSVSPGFPDFHGAMFRFPSVPQTRIFCGPGGCRGISGPTSYLYPFEDTSNTLPDQWTSSAQLGRWVAEVISGNARLYRLNGDGTKPGGFSTRRPEESWIGALHITVIGKAEEAK